MIPAAIVLFLVALPPQSFVKLEGPRLHRFYKTKSLSELGRPVLVRVPPKALNALQRPWKGSAYRSFRYKGVTFLVHGKAPSLLQTLRKIRRNKKLDIRVRGIPRRMRREGKTLLYVRVHSMKAVGLLRRRKKRTGPRFLEQRNEGRTNVPEEVMSRVLFDSIAWSRAFESPGKTDRSSPSGHLFSVNVHAPPFRSEAAAAPRERDPSRRHGGSWGGTRRATRERRRPLGLTTSSKDDDRWE